MLGNPHRLTSVPLPATTAATLSAPSEGAANITTVQPWTIQPWRCGSTALMGGTVSFTTYTAPLPTAQNLIASWIPQICLHDHNQYTGRKQTAVTNMVIMVGTYSRPPPPLQNCVFYMRILFKLLLMREEYLYIHKLSSSLPPTSARSLTARMRLWQT
jgi:hypothetical protein